MSSLVTSSNRSSSHICRNWVKGAVLSASLATAVMLGLSAAPAFAAPANGTGGPPVFTVSPDSGTGSTTVFSATVTPDNGTGGPTVF